MARRYSLSPEAQHDLADIRSYYLTEAGPSVAQTMTGALINGFRLVSGTPGARHRREDLTNWNVKFWPVFSHLIIYNPGVRPLRIIRVLHGNRDIAALLQRGPSPS